MIVEKEENRDLLYFNMTVDGKPCRCAGDIKTGKCYAYVEDIMKNANIEMSLFSYLSTDGGLDFLIAWRKANPDKVLCKTKKGGDDIYLIEIPSGKRFENLLKLFGEIEAIL